MKCPICPETTLVMSDRQEIEIDYCPQCRGVWLDRGELDKIIERAAPQELTAPTPQSQTPNAFTTTAPIPISPAPSGLQNAPRSAPSVNIPSVLRDVLRGGDDRDNERRRERDDYKRRDYDDDNYKHHKRKKSGFLGELFDFD